MSPEFPQPTRVPDNAITVMATQLAETNVLDMLTAYKGSGARGTLDAGDRPRFLR